MLPGILAAGVCVFLSLYSPLLSAAPVDDQTPVPEATALNEHTLSRQHCRQNSPHPDQDSCIAVRVHYPAGMAGWLDDFVRHALLDRLAGPASVNLSVAQALDQFPAHSVQQGIRLYDLGWQALGRYNALTVLVEQVQEELVYGEIRLLRQFFVFDDRSHQPVLLADIIVANQGEALAVLQENALVNWFVNQAGMDIASANATVQALPVKYSDNWAMTRNGLVFGYDPVLLGDRILAPLPVVDTGLLEGVIRPDILTAARSWPVDVAVQLRRSLLADH